MNYVNHIKKCKKNASNYTTWAILSINFKYFGMYGKLYIE